MIALLANLAVAVPPPFEQVDQIDSYRGCVILVGPQPAEGGVAPLRAECHWTDVSLAAMQAVLSRYEEYGKFIECMHEVKIVRTDGDRILVWQYDKLGFGLSPRESQTWMKQRPVDGGFEIVWKTAPEAFTPVAGSVITPRNEGFWYVTKAPGGGVNVIEEVSIDPGGSLPTWVVNWFQTYATADALRLLHDLAIAEG